MCEFSLQTGALTSQKWYNCTKMEITNYMYRLSQFSKILEKVFINKQGCASVGWEVFGKIGKIGEFSFSVQTLFVESYKGPYWDQNCLSCTSKTYVKHLIYCILFYLQMIQMIQLLTALGRIQSRSWKLSHKKWFS